MPSSSGPRSPTSAQKRTAKRKAAKADLRQRRQGDCDAQGPYLRAVYRKGKGWDCVVDRKGFRQNATDLAPKVVAEIKARMVAENRARQRRPDAARDAAEAECRAQGGLLRVRRDRSGGFACVVDRRALREEYGGLASGEKAFYRARVAEENRARREAVRDMAKGMCAGEFLRPVTRRGRFVRCVVDRARYRRAVKDRLVSEKDRELYDAALAEEDATRAQAAQDRKDARVAEPYDCAKPPRQQNRCLDHAQDCGWYWGKRKEGQLFACRKLRGDS